MGPDEPSMATVCDRHHQKSGLAAGSVAKPRHLLPLWTGIRCASESTNSSRADSGRTRRGPWSPLLVSDPLSSELMELRSRQPPGFLLPWRKVQEAGQLWGCPGGSQQLSVLG